ncbi:collagen alpha-1(X) chain-like [Asterias rubens]|uniref:collagen alpha-1(X) chain-like n=1 Tax=Asterias rubens TaxID=7604 RepID=UPI0014559882|nr:collagen alpha-1(X) chain-like [Asterias rubens]
MVAKTAVSPDPEMTCNSCCQGPAGIPGIPGSNGNHGQGLVGSPGEAGQPGAKGDMGSDGLVGEPGAKGDHGQKGEQGVGQPGKQGPQGLHGMNGLKGERGEPRPAGQTGEAGECSTRRSAFTAVRNTASSPPSSWDPLPFEELLFSEEGTDFKLNNGTFTCNVPGVYVLMFSVYKSSGESLYVQLRKNGNSIVSGGVHDADNHQVSSSAVIPLHYGDQVHLAVLGQVYSNSNHYTSFTGFLLYEI